MALRSVATVAGSVSRPCRKLGSRESAQRARKQARARVHAPAVVAHRLSFGVAGHAAKAVIDVNEWRVGLGAVRDGYALVQVVHSQVGEAVGLGVHTLALAHVPAVGWALLSPRGTSSLPARRTESAPAVSA